MVSIWVYVMTLVLPVLFYLGRLLLKILRWFWHISKIQKIANRFTLVKPHWLKGHEELIPELDEAYMMTYLDLTSKSQKGAFAIYVGFLPIIVVCHPDTAKLVTKTTEPKGMIAATGSGYKLLIPWLGDGLLTSHGNKWFRNRRLLTPGFHFEILKPYVKIYNECANKMIDRLRDSCKSGASVEIFQHVSLCTLNVMTRCAFSSKEDLQTNGAVTVYVQAVNEMSSLIQQRVLNPLYYFDSIYACTQKGKEFFKLCKLSHAIADDIIQNRINELKKTDANCTTNKSDRYVDFLDILLLAKDTDGNGLTNMEIRDEVETFMFAGHDTTACAISWILYNIAGHKDIQRKAQEEVDGILNKKPEVEWENLNEIPYLTRCIKESLRLHPPVPSIMRELSAPLELTPGNILPAGTVIEVNQHTIHHNPKVWGEDHMKYDPDRFLPDNIAKMSPHAFIPFSAGPRNCIGQVFALNEVKTTVMRILHQFDLERDPDHKVEMQPDLVLRAKYGIKLHFKKREP